MLKTVASITNAIGALNYKGTWNASANSPTLASGVGTKGDYYYVNVAGTTNLDGITDWQVGDFAVFNGSAWQKVDNTDAVISVNGQTGAVVLTAANVGATPNTTFVIAGTALSGGGQLTGNVTLNLADTSVITGTYGTASQVSQITIDAQGRITSASNVSIAIANTAVSGLGTMSVQNSNSVSISGGSITANLTSSNVNLTGTTAANATFATSSLPLVPEGYITIQIGGVNKKIPYYGV